MNLNNEKSMRKWQCLICNFMYEEHTGMTEEGITPGTTFKDIPNDWVCPCCGASKDDFIVIE